MIKNFFKNIKKNIIMYIVIKFAQHISNSNM